MVKNILLRRNIILEIISALLILLFFYTSISKLYDLPNFERVLKASPLINGYASFVAWSIPIMELVVCLWLFFQKTRRIGFYSSFILMLLFTLYLTYMIYFTPNLPCSCGGVISQMTWKQHLVFNVFYTLLAALGIFLSNRKSNDGKIDNLSNSEAPAII